jgi:hypothetical protein
LLASDGAKGLEKERSRTTFFWLLSTGGKLRTETASQGENLPPSEKRISYSTATPETSRNSQFEQTSSVLPSCEK